MHAQRWIARRFGGPEMLERIELELPEPEVGEALIEVRACGMNPADHKRLGAGDASMLPIEPGFEVAGVVAAIGPGTELGSGGGEVGDEVVAFRITGGYSTALLTSAANVFAKPTRLSYPQAANLLLAAATAADALRVVSAGAGDTVVVHGAAGAVGTSVTQQARRLGARVIGTCSERDQALVAGLGAIAVRYGDGVQERVREAAPGGADVAVDTVGANDAVDASRALVADRGRIVSIAASARAHADGFRFVGGSNPESTPFRDSVRASLVDLAAAGELTVVVGETFGFDEAPRALERMREPHAHGQLALIV
jgi:NADPH:quinone reductase-like Zn-dependent oxidoreductase